MKIVCILLFCVCCPSFSQVSRIAFGSCNKHDLPQPLWPKILESKPDLWLWTGDIIYGDTDDMTELRSFYDLQKAQPGYQSLLSEVPVIGIWDDHDYGWRDAGKEYAFRKPSQQILLDFLDEPLDTARRKQEGIYTSHTYGKGKKSVKLILLDGRYHREMPDDNADPLGAVQWDWLAKELSNSQAAINFIVSGIQVLPTQHIYEKWENFPQARQRLFRLIAKSKAPGVIFLSGDRHIAELSKLDKTPSGYPFYEITSSGMTHSFAELEKEPNDLRLGNFYNKLHYGLVVIDWESKPVTVDLQIRGLDNKIVRSQKVGLDTLQTGPVGH